MTPVDILVMVSWLLKGVFVLLVIVVAYLSGRRIFERVRAARWRRIREPRCYGGEGGHPVTGEAGDMPHEKTTF